MVPQQLYSEDYQGVVALGSSSNKKTKFAVQKQHVGYSSWIKATARSPPPVLRNEEFG